MNHPYIRIEEFVVTHPEEYPFGKVRVRTIHDEDGRYSVALAVESTEPNRSGEELALTPDETIAISEALRRAANEAAAMNAAAGDSSDGFEVA